MPLGEIHLFWLPWQGNWGGGEYLLGFYLQVVFEELGREISVAFLDLNNWLASFGSMFLEVWGLRFFVFLLCPWLVSRRYISAEINCYTCKCWSKHQEMPRPWRLPEHWKEAPDSTQEMCRGKADRSRECSDRYWWILIPAEHSNEKKYSSTNWTRTQPKLKELILLLTLPSFLCRISQYLLDLIWSINDKFISKQTQTHTNWMFIVISILF